MKFSSMLQLETSIYVLSHRRLQFLARISISPIISWLIKMLSMQENRWMKKFSTNRKITVFTWQISATRKPCRYHRFPIRCLMCVIFSPPPIIEFICENSFSGEIRIGRWGSNVRCYKMRLTTKRHFLVFSAFRRFLGSSTEFRIKQTWTRKMLLKISLRKHNFPKQFSLSAWMFGVKRQTTCNCIGKFIECIIKLMFRIMPHESVPNGFPGA